MAIWGDDWMGTEYAHAHGFDWKAHFVVTSSPCPYQNSYFDLAFWFLSNIHEWRHGNNAILIPTLAAFPRTCMGIIHNTHKCIKRWEILHLNVKWEVHILWEKKSTQNLFRYLQILFFSSTFGDSLNLDVCNVSWHLPRIINNFAKIWWDGAVTLYLTSCKNFEGPKKLWASCYLNVGWYKNCVKLLKRVKVTYLILLLPFFCSNTKSPYFSLQSTYESNIFCKYNFLPTKLCKYARETYVYVW